MPEPAQHPYIEFREVSKAFGDNVVLDRVSFNVMPGETVCILGRSGVGKSVSLQLLMGFLKADSGRVIVAGEDVTDFSEEQMEAIRKKVTMVFQNGALFDSLTVGENVAFPLRESRDLSEEQIYEIVDGLLKMVGVQEMRDLLPSDLSTGMKRSVAIARALAARPECILYDEPTTMVDPLMAQLLGDLIKRLKLQLNLTSIVVTHDMRLAKNLADRVVFLYEGKAIFFGTYAEMEKSHGAHRAGVPRTGRVEARSVTPSTLSVDTQYATSCRRRGDVRSKVSTDEAVAPPVFGSRCTSEPEAGDISQNGGR